MGYIEYLTAYIAYTRCGAAHLTADISYQKFSSEGQHSELHIIEWGARYIFTLCNYYCWNSRPVIRVIIV